MLRHLPLGALLIANRDADLCIRMRRRDSLTSACGSVLQAAKSCPPMRSLVLWRELERVRKCGRAAI